jgi:hypothetical protein
VGEAMRQTVIIRGQNAGRLEVERLKREVKTVEDVLNLSLMPWQREVLLFYLLGEEIVIV